MIIYNFLTGNTQFHGPCLTTLRNEWQFPPISLIPFMHVSGNWILPYHYEIFQLQNRCCLSYLSCSGDVLICHVLVLSTLCVVFCQSFEIVNKNSEILNKMNTWKVRFMFSNFMIYSHYRIKLQLWIWCDCHNSFNPRTAFITLHSDRVMPVAY